MPETYYVTNHYVNHTVVLVRLSAIHIDPLRDLLEIGWRFMSANGVQRRATKRSR